MAVLSNIFHRSDHTKLAPYLALLPEIHKHKKTLQKSSDDALKQASHTLKERVQKEASISSDAIIEGFALACEAARRTVQMDPFNVQITGGLVLHHGNLAEMQTGEGKTLVAVLPAYLNALTGQGVHILTFNDYLARRDAEWMGPIYSLLGLTVAFVTESMIPSERQDAYRADITYITAKEAGFDYLRDRLCQNPNDLVHRPVHYAIIDEADSILIDEARVPLVIAGNIDKEKISPNRIAEIIANLKVDIHYETAENDRDIFFTESGLDTIEEALSCGDLHTSDNLNLLTELNCALHVHSLIHRNINYIVRDQKIEIIDEFTGRVAPDRRWPDGLQAALEAKERLPIQSRGTVLGSITLQHFIQTYPKCAGMTATAQSAAEEFQACYDLNVITIPPNQPCIRIDHPDIVFTHKEAKHNALIEEIARVHKTGRPILVGTSSVEESDHLATNLQQTGITCSVLNAKNDAQEAKIIAHAGQWSAITISTNMAGRGTDIKLGGPEGIDRDKIIAFGGLYVIGTNRHESLRIDNQLRGRAGRQGDPGSSRFFISLEDYLIKRFGIDNLIPPKHRPTKQSEALDNPIINREIDRAQRIAEGQNADIRKSLHQYAQIVNKQRQNVQEWRHDILLNSEPPPSFEEHAPERLSQFTDKLKRHNIEKKIALTVIDTCWREHLATITHIQDGIHLVSMIGQNPLEAFHKAANEAFQQCQEAIDDEIIEQLANITPDGIISNENLKTPASTWSYLVHDKTLAQKLESLLVGNRNIGFAAGGALLLGPIFLIIGIYRRLFKK